MVYQVYELFVIYKKCDVVHDLRYKVNRKEIPMIDFSSLRSLPFSDFTLF